MGKRSVYGCCRICGLYKQMSFGHVPPKAAFNDCPAVSKEIFKLIDIDPNDYFNEKGKISQKGVGYHTLCTKCDNDTGSWYGTPFAKWARQGLEALTYTQGGLAFYPFRIHPLPVIKQIVCMFFSVTDQLFSCNHPDVVKFVLDRNERYLNPDIRIYVFLNSSRRMRHIGGAHKALIGADGLNLQEAEEMTHAANTAVARSRLLSEVACYPLGYVMFFGPAPPDNQLVDISFFSGYSYSECTSLYLKLPVLPVETYFPTDYRRLEQVRRDAERNQCEE